MESMTAGPRRSGIEPRLVDALETGGDRAAARLAGSALRGPLLPANLGQKPSVITSKVLTEGWRRREPAWVPAGRARSEGPSWARFPLVQAGDELVSASAALAWREVPGESTPGPVRSPCGTAMEGRCSDRTCPEAASALREADEADVLHP
ncbi:MAG: hypothetical protein ACYDD0_06285 [Candidatus Dormibacteria bacterium]